MARLRHPNVVQIYDVGHVDGLPFVALELLEGGSLEARDRLGTPQPERRGGRAGGDRWPAPSARRTGWAWSIAT